MSNECNLLDQMLLDFQYIDFNFDEEFSGSDSESDSDDINANYRERINRMNPYYSSRMDIFFTYFHDDQLIQTFRFNRVGIQYITGIANDLT